MTYAMSKAFGNVPENAVVQLLNVDFSQGWANALVKWDDKEYWVPFGLLIEI